MAENNVSEAKKYLVFKLDNEEYGLDISKITTIIEKNMNITRVPKQPVFLKGVINLRGEIIPVLSLRLRFGLADDVYNEETRIIIIKLDEISAGLIVDSVAEVVELNEETTESISNVTGEHSLEYLNGVGKLDGRIITLLNLEKIVTLEESPV
jgi:purine-binding chemotaxis protein CheW